MEDKKLDDDDILIIEILEWSIYFHDITVHIFEEMYFHNGVSNVIVVCAFFGSTILKTSFQIHVQKVINSIMDFKIISKIIAFYLPYFFFFHLLNLIIGWIF